MNIITVLRIIMMTFEVIMNSTICLRKFEDKVSVIDRRKEKREKKKNVRFCPLFNGLCSQTATQSH